MSSIADLTRIARALERYAKRRPSADQARFDFGDRPAGVTPPPVKAPEPDPQGTLGDFARRRRSFDRPRDKPVQGSLLVEENPSLRVPPARAPKPDQTAFLEGQEGAELKMRAAQARPARPNPQPGMGPTQGALPDEPATPGMGPHRVDRAIPGRQTALDPPTIQDDPADDDAPAGPSGPFDPMKSVSIRREDIPALRGIARRAPRPPAAGAVRAVEKRLGEMSSGHRADAIAHIGRRDPGFAKAVAGMGPHAGPPKEAPSLFDGMAERRAAREAREAAAKARGLPLDEFAQKVVAAARGMKTGRFGDNKVFISHLYRQMQSDPALAGMDLDTFKRRLAEANNARHLDLARADLVQAMDPDDVRESETPWHVARFHFVRHERYARSRIAPSDLKPTKGQGGLEFGAGDKFGRPAGPPTGPKGPRVAPQVGGTQEALMPTGGTAEPREGPPARTVVVDPEEQARPRMPHGRAQRMRPMPEQAQIPAVARPEKAATGVPAAELARAVADPGRHLLVAGARVDDPRWAAGLDPHLEHVHTFEHPEHGAIGVYRGTHDDSVTQARQFLAGQHSLHGGVEPMGGPGPMATYVMGLAREGQPGVDEGLAGGLGPASPREFRMRPERPAAEAIRRPPPLPPAGQPQATPEPTAVTPEVAARLDREHGLLRRMKARTPDQSARLLMHGWRTGRVGADAEGNPLDHGRAERFANLLHAALSDGNEGRAEQLAKVLGTRNPALALRAADDYRRLHHLGEIRPAIPPARPGQSAPIPSLTGPVSNISRPTRAAMHRQRAMFADQGKDAAIAAKEARDRPLPPRRDELDVALEPGSPAAEAVRGMGFGGEAGYRRFLASRGLYRSSNGRIRYAGQIGFDFGGEAMPGFPRPKKAAPALRARVRKEATPVVRPAAEPGASFVDTDIRQGSAGPSEAERAQADARGAGPRADRVAAILKGRIGAEESDQSDGAYKAAARSGRVKRVDDLEFVQPEPGLFSGAADPAEGSKGATPDEGEYRRERAGKAGRAKLDLTDSFGALMAVAKGLTTPDRATDLLKTKSERLAGSKGRPSRANKGTNLDEMAEARRKRARAAIGRQVGEIEEAAVNHPGLGPLKLSRPERAAIRSNRAALKRGASDLHGNS